MKLGNSFSNRKYFVSLYQYDFKSHFFELPSSGGGKAPRMHYLDEGKGEPIVMLHGNPTWSYYYRRLVPLFSSRYRVIVPDHIGCGRSDKPARYPYVLDQHVLNVEALLDHLKLSKFNLLVHDWGGPIGFGFAGKYPEKVRRIALLNTCGFRLKTVPWFLKLVHIPVLGEILVRQLNMFLLLALRLGTVSGATKASPTRDGYLAPYLSAGDRHAIYRFVLDIPLSPAHPSYPAMLALEENLSRLQNIPLLILWGMKDPVFTPGVLADWMTRFPRAEVERFENGGHFVLEDELDSISKRLTEFFGRTDG